MNHFKLSTAKNEDGELIGPNEVYMHLSEVTENGVLGELMHDAFEIEMLRGRCEPDIEDGNHYWFELSNEKMALLRQALMLAFFSPAAN
jgi:hypothetical protein